MTALTNTLENKLVDFLFRGQSLGLTLTTLYVGLFTAAPSDTGGGTEVSTSGTGYGRVAVTSSLANWSGTQSAGSTVASSGTGGTISNNNAITFGTPTASWGTVTHFGLFDASTGGNLLVWSNLAFSQSVDTSNTAPTFAAGALSFQIDN